MACTAPAGLVSNPRQQHIQRIHDLTPLVGERSDDRPKFAQLDGGRELCDHHMARAGDVENGVKPPGWHGGMIGR